MYVKSYSIWRFVTLTHFVNYFISDFKVKKNKKNIIKGGKTKNKVISKVNYSGN